MPENTNTDILLAGAVAAFTVDLLIYPLDTLKTRLQSPDYARRYLHASTKAVDKAALFRGLYQGVGSVIIATLPSSGAFFTTYEGVKSVLANHNPSLPKSNNLFLPQPIVHATASSIAELVSCAILTPAEVIKQNAQVVKASPGSPNATLQTLTRFRSNPSALWRGYSALAGRNLPFTALQFPMFEKLKEMIQRHRDRRGKTRGTIPESGLVTAVSAGTAGSVAALITTPIDVVKTRIMLAAAEGDARAQPTSSSTAPNGVKSGKDSMIDAVGKTVQSTKNGVTGALSKVARPTGRKSSFQIGKEILVTEGISGLWRGGALRAIWTMLGSGLYLGVYESGRIWLKKRREKDAC